MDFEVMKEICAYLAENINEEISADEIADYFHYNKFYLMRKFKEYTGFTINEYINECRVYNSTDPLIFTDDSVLKIALNNGFNSQEYYSEKFKDVIGLSPLKFRGIYTGLLAIAEKSKDAGELNYIKDSLTELKVYQEYLNNMGYYVDEKVVERPLVKIIKNVA